MPGPLVAAIAGTALIGSSFLSSRSQSKAAESAANAAASATKKGINAQLKMYEQTREDYKPFYEAGKTALTTFEGLPAGAIKAPTLPSADIPFEFDPEDKMYKIQQEEGEKAINRALVARGLYGSRAGVNVLTDFNRKLIGDEVEKQYGRRVDKYGREYTSAIDIYNIENQIAQGKYGKYLDLTKLGTGAAIGMGGAAMQTGGQISSSYSNLGNVLARTELAKGQAQAGMWQDIGSLPVNALASYYYGKQAGLWGN